MIRIMKPWNNHGWQWNSFLLDFQKTDKKVSDDNKYEYPVATERETDYLSPFYTYLNSLNLEYCLCDFTASVLVKMFINKIKTQGVKLFPLLMYF